VQNPTDAEDLTQEVFIKVIDSISSFKEESKFSTWLYRIATTKALDLLRSRKRKKRFGFIKTIFGNEHPDEVQLTDFHHPGVQLEQKERAAVLFKAIAKLPENQKVAFTLHKLEGLSYQEISNVMDTTVSAVESLMSRARVNLKKELSEFYNSQYR
jgi:RNA polymerase sigma factor (sigma-70 family)